MSGLKCPRCGLYSPETADRCDCGYAFRSGAPVRPDNRGPVMVPTVAVSSPFTEVSVVDVKMPFGSMVLFMVKWALASIPAFFILFVFGLILGALFGGVGLLTLGHAAK